MNLGIYALLTLCGVIGLVYGIKMKNKILLIISIIFVLCFGILVGATLLLVNSLNDGKQAYGAENIEYGFVKSYL